MKHYLVLLSLIFSFVFISKGQNRSQGIDKIVQKDYTLVEGKILKVSDKEIEYSTVGSTVVYTIAISKVAKLVFANGTTKEFSQEQLTPNSKETSEITSLVDQKIIKNEKKNNTIAVLPLVFMNTTTLQKSPEMSKFAQNDIYSKLVEKSANIFPLTLQDLRVTNSLLKKAGIDNSNIDETPIEELVNILGVDHIIAGKVSYTTKTIVLNNANSSTTINSEKKGIESKTTSGSVAQDDIRYDYTVYLDMYRNTDKIYSKTRIPILNLKDSWMDSMSYLLKRCPIYSK